MRSCFRPACRCSRWHRSSRSKTGSASPSPRRRYARLAGCSTTSGSIRRCRMPVRFFQDAIPRGRPLSKAQPTRKRRPMKIAIIGGGPGGLYFSLLAKKHNPTHEIRVFEQNPADATYGWGVVFSDIGLNFLCEADPEFFKEFTAHHQRCEYMDIVHRGTHVQIHSNHFSRTSRIDMLNILQRACLDAGVEIEFEKRITDVVQVVCFVLIFASVGANSAVRTRLFRLFQP